jgi:CRP/FNR family cyclic AMP-dependent transcriptional regulator
MIGTLKPILSRQEIFKDLNEGYLDMIVACASNVRFNTGTFIFREGEPANKFYLIREGKVALQIHHPGRGALMIETLGEGDLLGWSWLFPPYQWQFDALVVDRMRAIAMDGKCLREKCEQDYHLGYDLMKRFSRIMTLRLQAARLQLLDLYGDKI